MICLYNQTVLRLILVLLILVLYACSAPATSGGSPEPTQALLRTETTEPVVTASNYVPSFPAISTESLQPGQTPYAFLSNSGVEVRYLFYLPENYDSNKQWPLIVFLHGNGEIGRNIDRLYESTPLNYVEVLTDFPFMVVSPQLPDGFWTQLLDPINELLDYLIEVLPVDKNHIYLTGISLGGYGTWQYALHFPDRFAAIAPISGGPTLSASNRVPEDICILKDLPIWAFHGADDRMVPPEQDIEPVAALEACGGNVQLTLYSNTGHDAWVQTYSDPAFYEWLLEQSK